MTATNMFIRDGPGSAAMDKPLRMNDSVLVAVCKINLIYWLPNHVQNHKIKLLPSFSKSFSKKQLLPLPRN